ncbi:MAG: 2-oxo acid dehydrogenase subunit E2 [Planctomycetes bacterium]|nr:2-oxo acid dehydrogenase subunit E2 [Planctomycetota bacterium]
MAREFVIPAIDEGVESVDLASLTVSEGDVIKAGAIVAEVETDKAAADIEIDFGGKVTRIHASPGDTIAVGSVLLSIEESAGAESAPAAAAPAAPVAAPPPAEPPKAEVTPAPPAPAPKPAPAKATAPADDEGAPAPAGPATRRLARQLGVDLHGIAGSAAGGRITQEDVKAHVKSRMEGGAASGGGGHAPPPLPDFSKWGETERVPLNKIGRSAAANLSMCWNVIPHVTQHDVVDITELEAARRNAAEIAKKTGAPKVTMTAIAMKAAAICLKEFPKFNAALDPQTNELVYRKYFHIGCAVDTPNGLLVPVIQDCDQKSITEIAAALTDVAVRARDGGVKLSEMQGSCFTITNLGGIGGTSFTPIVNYPEVAILGMSRGRTELKVNDGEIEERLMLPLSMSYDHRVINGADAARFVVRLGQLLSDYFHLTVQS